jgi:hypothetical protein
MWNESLDITHHAALTREELAAGRAAGQRPGWRRELRGDTAGNGSVSQDRDSPTGNPADRTGFRVLLFGGDHGHELGDRAVLDALCESLQHADPDVRITIKSARRDLEALPGVASVQPCGALGRLVLPGVSQSYDLVLDAGEAAGSSPDPAFALAPAPDDQARRYLHGIGLDPHGPILGVAMRGFHRPGGVVQSWLREWAGLGRDEDDREVARVFDRVARAVETLARRLHASVLLMPASSEGYEADSQYCHELAAMLELPSVRVARIDDPRLYKAVCGRLRLMISARSHPLILAAGMGVPGIGLGHDGLFRDCFDPLGVPRRVIGTREIRDDLQSESIVALAEDALDDPTDLRARAEGLRRRVQQAAAALLGRRKLKPAAADAQALATAFSIGVPRCLR